MVNSPNAEAPARTLADGALLFGVGAFGVAARGRYGMRSIFVRLRRRRAASDAFLRRLTDGFM